MNDGTDNYVLKRALAALGHFVLRGVILRNPDPRPQSCTQICVATASRSYPQACRVEPLSAPVYSRLDCPSTLIEKQVLVPMAMCSVPPTMQLTRIVRLALHAKARLRYAIRLQLTCGPLSLPLSTLLCRPIGGPPWPKIHR